MGNLIRASCGCGVKTFGSISEVNSAAPCNYCKQSFVFVPDSVKSATAMPMLQRTILQKRIKDGVAKVTDNDDKMALYKALGFIAFANGAPQNAKIFFDKVIAEDPSDDEAYYYRGLAKLGGKRPFSQSRSIIDEIIDDINLAIGIEPKGKYYYLKALLVADYYEAKYLNYVSKEDGKRIESRELLDMAEIFEVSAEDKEEVFKFVKFISKPKGF